MKLAFNDMGDQELKNIPRPVRVFSVAAKSSPSRRLPHPNTSVAAPGLESCKQSSWGVLARSLDVQLTQAESLRSIRERPDNPDATDLAMRGWAALNRPSSPAHLEEALKLFNDSLQRDAHLTSALVGKARSLTYLAWLRFSATPAEDLTAAEDAIAQVLADMPDHPMARFVKGDILKAKHEFDPAISEFEAAIESDRNLALAYEALGHAKLLIGRSNEALAPIEKALRLSPLACGRSSGGYGRAVAAGSRQRAGNVRH